MSDRGDYRSFYCVFWDDPDVHALSDAAYRVLTTIKGTLPASGLGFVYVSQLADRCRKSAAEVDAALCELERAKPDAPSGLGWIVRERNIVWVVNGLRFEPTLTSANGKHRTFLRERLLAPFGHRPIVAAFRRYYADWFVDAAPLPAESDVPSSANGIREGIDRVSKHSPIQSSPSQSDPAHSGIEDEARSPAADADSPLTALSLVVWANTAVAERWGEQPNPYTTAGASVLLDALIPLSIAPNVVRTSIYRQCRAMTNEKPPRTIKYFLQGIESDWQTEQTRRQVAASGERPPPRAAPRAKSSPRPAPAAPSSPYADRFSSK